MKNQSSPRFEVDYKTRIEQQRKATNAVRLPRLGYQEYRVYDIEEPKKESAVPSGWYGVNGQQIGRGIRTGPTSVIISGKKYFQYNLKQIRHIVDDLPASYTVKWLKPKQATLLRLKGHRVEEL